MYPYFVRTYKLADGSTREVAAVYESYQDAENDLPKTDAFNEIGIQYGQVEKRFSPTPIFATADATDDPRDSI